MRRWLMLLLLSVPMLACGQARPEAPGWVTTPADSLLAERVLAELAPYVREPVPELMARAGKTLEGQQYVAGTLDELPDEHLCIYLTRTDCIIFVETCLALSRTAARGGDFRMFADEIRQSRYRGGRVESYADRLHYTTEWARQGEDRGVLKDVTLELGGTRLDHPVNYMSEHPGSYPLMNDVDAIRKVEDNINSKPRCYIPKNRLVQALQGIRNLYGSEHGLQSGGLHLHPIRLVDFLRVLERERDFADIIVVLIDAVADEIPDVRRIHPCLDAHLKVEPFSKNTVEVIQ